MDLNNGYCGTLFGEAEVTLRDSAECASCAFALMDITFCLLPDGTVRATVVTGNTSGVELNYLIIATQPTGTYYNAQGVMQQGLQSHTHIFRPDSPVFDGQLLDGYISAWYPEPLNFHCQQLFESSVMGNCDADGEGAVYGARGPRDSVPPEEEAPFRLYPNPATDGVRVVYEAGQDERCWLKIRNVLGQELVAVAVAADESPVYLSMKGMPAGVYMVECCKDGETVAVQKLIKK